MSFSHEASGKGPLCAPEPLGPKHDLQPFRSGEPAIDAWLKQRALKNQGSGASRTYMVCLSGTHEVVGFYCLATGALSVVQAPGKVRRNMPDPIPVMVIGRLAVHAEWQGQGLGRALLNNALRRTLQVAEVAGVRAVLVHAISARTRAFYEASGFSPSPVDPMALVITLAEVRAML